MNTRKDVEKAGHKSVREVIDDVVYCDDCGYSFYYGGIRHNACGGVIYYKFLYKNRVNTQVAEFPTCNELIIKDIIE